MSFSRVHRSPLHGALAPPAQPRLAGRGTPILSLAASRQCLSGRALALSSGRNRARNPRASGEHDPSPVAISRNSSFLEKVEMLRELLASSEITQAPACHDALSASLVQQSGFKMTFMSGFSVCAARAGLPDTGLLSYGEMVEAGRLIAGAVDIPVVGDADTGYGSPMNVRRTVAGYRQAGMAGAIIEDQEWPKACGHTGGRRVVDREEALLRVRAAVDERDEGPDDIVVVARSDARQAVSVEEALWRAAAFADAGADMVFVDALQSREEMRALCAAVPHTPKLANMLEGGGRTPILSPLELQDLGFSVVVYPLSLMGASMRAMQDALAALRSGRLPPPGALPDFAEMQRVVGFPGYYDVAARYRRSAQRGPVPSATTTSSTPAPSSSSSSSSSAGGPGHTAAGSEREGRVAEDGVGGAHGAELGARLSAAMRQAPTPSAAPSTLSSAVEAASAAGAEAAAAGAAARAAAASATAEAEAAVVAAAAAATAAAHGLPLTHREGFTAVHPDAAAAAAVGDSPPPTPAAVVEAEFVLPPAEDGGPPAAYPPGLSGDGQARVMLCVRVTGRDGRVKLDVRVPGGFLTSLAKTIPAVAGLDINRILKRAQGGDGGTQGSGVLVDILDDRSGDRVQIIME